MNAVAILVAKVSAGASPTQAGKRIHGTVVVGIVSINGLSFQTSNGVDIFDGSSSDACQSTEQPCAF